MHTRVFAALAASAALLSAAPASAAPIFFDLTRSIGPFDNVPSLNFADSSGLSLEITANPGDRQIDYDEDGIGVQGFLEDEQLDGFGADESLYFSFSQNVQLISATFSRVGSNDDFRLITGDGITIDGDPNVQNPFDFLSLSLIDDWFEFTVAGTNDDYKLSQLVVARVSEPGVLALLAVGFAGALASRRRRGIA